MANECDPNTLMADAKCFACLSPEARDILQTYLLCLIWQNGGGTGTNCLLCGTDDPPTVTPDEDCTCAIYYCTAAPYAMYRWASGAWV